jgi:hypothetical protein
MKAKDKALLSFGSVAALMLFVAVGSALTPKSPSHRVVATVVDVYVAGARFPRTVIIAHAPRAIDAHAMFRESDDDNCRVGDEVDGTQSGISLVVDPHTCRRPASFTRRDK